MVSSLFELGSFVLGAGYHLRYNRLWKTASECSPMILHSWSPYPYIVSFQIESELVGVANQESEGTVCDF